MIKNILWDFDGVILDSMKIKGDGFVELFKEYDKDKVSLLEKYHYQNGGVSRFEKIKYFYNTILNREISEEKITALAIEFAKIIEKKLYQKENLFEESVEFIKMNYKNFDFHIVSGAEHKELNELCQYFGLSQYFKTINGSPTSKEILVMNIVEKYHYKRDETILIGDAMTDYNAAIKNNINFYGYNNPELKKNGPYIDSFKDFKI
ncbi:HAD family hydrolase [Sulfurimonas sp. HSL3-2]|uniref:HAD family hydrolase n=1 Tax=Hydrocurvibacter mobilis TaxID=3131936 RepID=UPI0031F956FE